MIDIELALLCARACSAAYELDVAKRKAQLDAAALVEETYVTGANDARALICHSRRGAQKILAFQGTQFSRGEIPSIMANVKAWPVEIGPGAVDAGYWEQVQSLAPVLPSLDGVTTIAGHSMGGDIAHLFANTGSVAPGIRLISFGAPKCADEMFWRNAKFLPIRFVHARDFAPVWPYFPDEWEQPGEQLWLHDGKCEPNLHRPVMPDSIADHSIDAYIAALAALSPHIGDLHA